MQILKGILIVIDIIIALTVIVMVMLQHKDDPGLSGTITGAGSNNFLDKNKGRTREGKLKRWTIISAILFAVVTIVLSIVYPL